MLTLDGPQLLSYNTTFQLADCYVSPFTFWHTIFEEKPCIPAMFLIQRGGSLRPITFKERVACIPALGKAKCMPNGDRKRESEGFVKETNARPCGYG